MEITLVNKVALAFKNDFFVSPGDNRSPILSDVPDVPMKPNNVTGPHTRQKLIDKLGILLAKYNLVNIPNATPNTISCDMKLETAEDGTSNLMVVRWRFGGTTSFFRRMPKILRESSGLQMKIEFNDSSTKISPVVLLKFTAPWEGIPVLNITISNISTDVVNNWRKENGTLSGKFTLNWVFEEKALRSLFCENMSVIKDHFRTLLTKMLENESEFDTSITSGSGTTVKCNRAVLVAGSPVFQAKFQSGMKESTGNTVKMTDLSEKEIRAFLGYLYKCDVTPALENVQTAWKLLKAGHFYQIDELVSVMREILMFRGNEKFSVDLALEMLMFVKNVSDKPGCKTGREVSQLLKGVWSDLNLKAVQVLKWYSKERLLKLLESENYKKLYEKTPQLAMELHSKFLQYVDTEAIEKDGINFM